MRAVMLNLTKSAVVALFLFVLGSAGAWSADFGTEPLTIRTGAGQELSFTVELAVTGDQREQGLMQRQTMAADRGMLFDFGESRQVYMWMKNTLLPLDMLFILEDGRISHIAANTVPLSENIVDSRSPVRFVLELNAGAAKKLGIGVGDTVTSARIKAATVRP